MKQSKVKHVHGGCTGPRMQTNRILGSLLGFDVIENHDKINNKILPVIKDKIVATNIQTQTKYSFTSDKAGPLLEGGFDSFEALYGDQLQLNKKFDDFFFYNWN